MTIRGSIPRVDVPVDMKIGRTRMRTDSITAFCQRHSFSKRESQILRLATEGFSNTQIAHQVGRAHSTVLTHWKRIYKKTRMKTRSEVLASLIRFQAHTSFGPK